MRSSQVIRSVVTLTVISILATASSAATPPVGERFVYKKVDDRELAIYVTKPADWKAGDTRPAIVFFHGGGWVGGAPGQFTEHSKYFASRGVVCFQVQYRLLDKKSNDPPTNCVQDAKSAMRWVRARAKQFGIDPNRIASAGGSAGGHLAAFVGTVDGGDAETDDTNVSAKSNAMLLFNPVYNNGPGEWGTARVGDRYREFSPAHNLTKDDPPSIVFLGSNDKLIPVATAEKFRDDSIAVGVGSILNVYEGQGHGFFNHGRDNNKWYNATVIASDRFLKRLGWIQGEPTLNLGGATTDQPQTSKVFRAGAAIAEITPPLGEMVVGGFVPFPANSVHDKLYARCVALDDGTTRLAIVVCDSLGIGRQEYDEARALIAKETEIDANQILMAATHTHSATRAQSEKYRGTLIRGIADAVHQAVANLEPASIGWGGIDEPSEVFNRRWYVNDPELRHNPFGGIDQVRMNPPRGNKALVEPAGPIDPEISVISVKAQDGTQLAVLANYSLHYVGGVDSGDISADYFGIFANRIEELVGQPNDKDASHPPMVGILSNGTSGDINNINFRGGDGRRWEPYEKMTHVAELVAQRTKEVCDGLSYRHWVPLRFVQRDLTLQMRKPDQKLIEYITAVEAKAETDPTHHRYEKIYAGRVRDLEAGPDEIDIPLQCLGIGDLAVMSIPFEVFVEIGLELKNKSPFSDTFTIELANDSRGYLPTPRQHELGGYETWMGTNRVQLDASDLITHSLLEMANEIKPSETTSSR